MQAALIAPRGLESTVLLSRYHLALALPETFSNKEYVRNYLEARRRGDYVILDNGACEGQLADSSFLFDMAHKIKPNEIVIPDTLGDYRETIKQARAFIADYSTTSYKYMAVVQGRTMGDFQRCATQFLSMEAITSIGIPRHMMTTLNAFAARIDLANWIERKMPKRFEMHFLGANAMWLGEIPSVTKYAPHVRGIDSSLPYTYTINNLELEKLGAFPPRPDKYFELERSLNTAEQVLLAMNIKTFKGWAASHENFRKGQ